MSPLLQSQKGRYGRDPLASTHLELTQLQIALHRSGLMF